jgi:hypothetical protein
VGSIAPASLASVGPRGAARPRPPVACGAARPLTASSRGREVGAGWGAGGRPQTRACRGCDRACFATGFGDARGGGRSYAPLWCVSAATPSGGVREVLRKTRESRTGSAPGPVARAEGGALRSQDDRGAGHLRRKRPRAPRPPLLPSLDAAVSAARCHSRRRRARRGGSLRASPRMAAPCRRARAGRPRRRPGRASPPPRAPVARQRRGWSAASRSAEPATASARPRARPGRPRARTRR